MCYSTLVDVIGVGSLLPYCLKQGLSCLMVGRPGLSSFCSPTLSPIAVGTLGLQVHVPLHIRLYTGAGHPNSGMQAYGVSLFN